MHGAVEAWTSQKTGSVEGNGSRERREVVTTRINLKKINPLSLKSVVGRVDALRGGVS